MTTTKQAPTIYIIKQGAATAPELLALGKHDPEGLAKLKQWANEEQEALGLASA